MNKKRILTIIAIIILTLVFAATSYYIFIYRNKEDNTPKSNQNSIKTDDKKNKDIKNIDDNPTDDNIKPTQSNTNNSTYSKLDEMSGEKVSLGNSSKGYEIYTINGVTYVDGIMIVNKSYGLPSTYYPTNTHTSAANATKVCNSCINEIAYKAFDNMKADASAVGLNIWIQSGYRPYSSQESIYNSYVARDGKEKADTYSARPGHSEHQSGLCFDLNSISDEFTNTAEGKWVNNNAHLYGFIIRFPKGKQDYTGYKYESWHLRYVGEDLAKKLYNNGDWISLEEYYGLSSEYKD